VSVFGKTASRGADISDPLVKSLDLIAEFVEIMQQQADTFYELDRLSTGLSPDCHDVEIYQGLLRRTCESLEDAATKLNVLVDRASELTPSHIRRSEWRLIIKIGLGVGIGLLLAFGLLQSAAWLLEEPQAPQERISEQQWMSMAEERFERAHGGAGS